MKNNTNMKPTIPTKFIIDRVTWFRGELKGSKLLNHKGRRCCLGFVAAQCGYEDKNLLGLDSPRNLEDRNDLPSFLIHETRKRMETADNSDLCYLLMEKNDDYLLSDEEREKFIIETFKQNGYEVEFIN